ncbi:hypothetical protein [Pseudoclavibacter terrae]
MGEPEGSVLTDLADGTKIDLVEGRVAFDLLPYGARRFRVSRPGDGRLR